MTELINKFQLGGQTGDGISSGRWIQVDDETITPQYSLKPVEIEAEHPLWSMPGYKGKQNKYRNFTLNDKNQIYRNIIAHNQAGKEYLKWVLRGASATALPIAAAEAPVALIAGIAGGYGTDQATNVISGGRYPTWGHFMGNILNIDPEIAGYSNPGAIIGGGIGSRVSTEAVGSAARSAVRTVTEGAKQVKEDVLNGAGMIGDILFPQRQPAMVGITRNGRTQTLSGNYRTQNFHIGKIEYNPDGTIKSSRGIGTPRSVKPKEQATQQPTTQTEPPKAVNVVDKKGNKRDLDIHETYVQRGRDVYSVERGNPHYTIEKGKDNYTPTKEGTKYYYDNVHTSSEVIPGQHVSTEINPVHTSTGINPVHTSTEINPEAVRNVTVPNNQTIKAGKYFDTKTGEPVTVVRTNTGTGRYNTTTGQYVQPNWLSRAWNNHPILTSLGTLGAATTTGTVIIPGIIGAISGNGAKHSIGDATEEVGKVADKAWNGTEEVEQRQRVNDSIQNNKKSAEQDSIDFNNRINQQMDSIDADMARRAEEAKQRKQQQQ